MKKKILLSLSIIILGINSVLSQEVWPVSLTGFTIPPRSLDLSVYGVDRPQDLVYTATLIDPVEPTLQVILRLSVERNGQPIYQTDPNFVAPILTLTNSVPLSIDGSILRPYLSKEALIGSSPDSRGVPVVPEGFNDICIEVISVLRNEPVSDKFCVRGNFQLNQPPQLIIPECGSKVQMPDNQNLIFTWQEMHKGGFNNPAPVEYEFELRRMPKEYYNINDAFTFSYQIFTTTTLTNRYVYTQADPILEPNYLYVWRVRARSLNHPTSLLFSNEGYSEVCHFYYYDGVEPDINMIDENRVAPTACEVFNTDYGFIRPLDERIVPINGGDELKVGYFDMKVISAQKGSDGFDGEGYIWYPMLGTNIHVEFKNIKINDAKRVFEADEIEAKVHDAVKFEDEQWRPKNIPQYIDLEYGGKILDLVESEQRYANTNAEVLGDKRSNLPFLLGEPTESFLGRSVIVNRIRFTPRNAFLYFVGVEKERIDARNLQVSEAAVATAIPATPFGIRSHSYLVIFDDPTIDRTQPMPDDARERYQCYCKGEKKNRG